MKKLRLNKKGKILVTILNILLSITIYNLTGKYGGLASEGIFYLMLILSGWGWLMIGQFVVYNFIWNK